MSYKYLYEFSYNYIIKIFKRILKIIKYNIIYSKLQIPTNTITIIYIKCIRYYFCPVEIW